ncbi:MAG: porin [Hyphomicrobiales bacterium]
MNIKSLILGSAAALPSRLPVPGLLTFPAAEPVEYVKVCGTFGTGFFYTFRAPRPALRSAAMPATICATSNLP